MMQNSVANSTFVSQPATIRIGTRTSQLALWQTNHVVAQLQRHWPNLQCELVHLVTQGDKRLDRPLPEIGGKGLFTAELEDALRRGEIDIAVHSLKDLPVEDPDDLIIGAILSREDTRDVMVARESWTLATLPKHAIVGTSSLRRQAQLLAIRADLDVRSIRGNIDTRLRKVLNGEYDAAIMAGAGLTRLGLTEHITEWISPEIMLSAPGQGALAVQCRENDIAIQALLAAIHDSNAAATTRAERQLLFRLGGGCSAPIGAWAESDDGVLELRARIASVDGRHLFDARASGSDADLVAQEVANLLMAQGARIALNREVISSVLAGKRVVVTRPTNSDAKKSDALAEGLQKYGAHLISIPAIQLVPLASSAELETVSARLGDFDWLIFTSPNAVEFFWSQTPDRTANSLAAGTKVAAVGPATRDALVQYGVRVDAMPDEYLGTEILSSLGELSGKRILLPRSAKGGSELPAQFRASGAVVEEIALYTPMPQTLSEVDRSTLASGVDVITFASGSAVRAIVNELRADERFTNFWSTVIVACIGPTTAAAAHQEGLEVQVVAEEHSAPGLVAALIAYFEKEPNRG